MNLVRGFTIGGLLCALIAGMAACGSNSGTSTAASATTTLSSITVSPSSLTGGQTATVTITLTGPAPAGGAQITLASTSDSLILPQFQTISGPVDLFKVPQGASTGTFKMRTLPVGSNQTVVLSATYNLAVTVQAMLTLTSANPLTLHSFTVNSATVTSGETVFGTVTLDAPAYSPGQQVFLTSSDPTVQPENPVTVQTNQTSAGFSIFTFPVNAQRTVTVTANLNTSIVQVQITLLPAPTSIASLIVVPYTAAGGASMTGTVTITPPADSGGDTVALSASFTNTATPAGTPLPVSIPSTVSIPGGASQAQFTVSSMAVKKTTDVTLTATLNTSAASFIVEIVPSISLAGISCQQSEVTSGNSLLCSVSLSIPAPAGGQAVQVTSSDNTALPVPGGGSVVVPPGSSSQSFILVGGTASASEVVTLTATLMGATSGSVTTMITMDPVNALMVSAVTLSASVVQGGQGTCASGSIGGTVTISGAAPPGGLTVSLASSDPSVQFCSNGMPVASTTVTVLQYGTTATFSLVTSAVASPVSVNVTASVNSGSQSAMLSVSPPPQLMSVTLAVDTVVGGNSVLGTVTLVNPAPSPGTTVTLQSDMNVAQPGTSVVVPQGSTTAVFLVTTLSVGTQQVATITASIGASSQQVMLTITPPVPDLRLMYFNPSTVIAGQSTTGTVVLTTPAPSGGVMVTLSSAANSVTVPASVTVNAGMTTATFPAMAAAGVNASSRVNITGTVTATVTNGVLVIPAQSGTADEQIVAGGETNSTDFPIRPAGGAFQSSLPAGDDTGFVTSIGLSTPKDGSTTAAFNFSTYLGGASSFGQVRDVFVDTSGNVFACGVTLDGTLATTSMAAQSAYGGGKDVFIAEFNSSGTLQYLSYLGGSGDETCSSLTGDSSGDIYVLGSTTNSTAMGAVNLTGTSGAFQTTNSGGNDWFVAKINPKGASSVSRLLWLTLVGGANDDFGNGRIVVSSTGQIAVSGSSQSTAQAPAPNGFPIPSGQGRPLLTGVGTFGVVVQLSGDGTALLSSSFLYGRTNGANPGTPTVTTATGGLTFDTNGNLYVCGQTDASDLPVSANAFQSTLKGSQDAYVAVLNASGVVTKITYLGGTSTSGIQACKGIAVDNDMNPVIVMPTDAADYPLTNGGTLSGPSDFAVTKLTTDLSTLIFSRLVGGSGSESADATRLQLDAPENMYFSLATNSNDFPVTANAVQSTFAGASGGANTNVVVVKLSSDGSTILYATYLGGTQNNSSTSVFYHHN